jgi:hypothetical protein
VRRPADSAQEPVPRLCRLSMSRDVG